MVTENDYVWVKLTENGAKTLNRYWIEMNKTYPALPLCKSNYKEDDIYSDQFYSVMDIFHRDFHISGNVNFKEISFKELKS
jgi:hypothetical protein